MIFLTCFRRGIAVMEQDPLIDYGIYRGRLLFTVA